MPLMNVEKAKAEIQTIEANSRMETLPLSSEIAHPDAGSVGSLGSASA
jgi:hypothetical protein